MNGCEFCEEMEGRSSARFQTMYLEVAKSRVALETSNFVAMPTIGQIFPGSMLILPKHHVETSARIPPSLQPELSSFLSRIMSIGRQRGEPVFFEHGALSCTGGSCGIYHAHIHVVPLPQPIDCSEFLPPLAAADTCIADALQELGRSEQYLLIGNEKEVHFGDVDALDFRPPSQYFRRSLAERFGLGDRWDWRKVIDPETDLLATLSLFGGGNVSECSGHCA